MSNKTYESDEPIPGEYEKNLKSLMEKSEPVNSSMSYSDKDRITELLTVCYNLINSFNGTSKVPPVDLYMPLVDAVTLFDNYDSSKIEPVVSQDQPKESQEELWYSLITEVSDWENDRKDRRKLKEFYTDLSNRFTITRKPID